MELDTTKLKQAGFRKTVSHDNCIVLDIGTGSFPRYIEVRPPGDDGSRMTAIWNGSLDLAVNNKVVCIEYSGNPIWRVQDKGGGDSGAGSIRVDKIWESDFGAVALQTDANGNVTLNGTRTLTIPTDLIHSGDADTKIGFDANKQTYTLGSKILLQMTKTTQDLVEIGDVGGAGDVDVNFNDGQMTLQGSDGRISVNNTTSSFFRLRVLEDTFVDPVNFAILGEVDTTNDTVAAYQSIGVAATNRYRGTQGSTDNKGIRAFDVNMFVHNTGTTTHAAAFRLDGRNLGAGTITNLYAGWVPTMANTGGGSITNIYGIKLDTQTTATNNFGFYQAGSGLNHFEDALEFIEMTAPDAGVPNTVRLFARDDGGGDTELCARFSTGLIQVIAPLEFGGISAEENSTQTTIASSGTAVQITIFDTNEAANGAIPDHTNDHVTINKAGTYLVVCSLTATSIAGAAAKFHFEVKKNNGVTHPSGIHADRNLAGGGSDTGSVSMSGLVVLSSGDTIELWVANETNTQNIIVEDANLAITMVGVNA